MPDLPHAAVALLEARFVPLTSRLVHAQRSTDGETVKLLVQLQDGLQVGGGPPVELSQAVADSDAACGCAIEVVAWLAGCAALAVWVWGSSRVGCMWRRTALQLMVVKCRAQALCMHACAVVAQSATGCRCQLLATCLLCLDS